MLIERLQVKGLLSFGPDGIDLPLEPLNVIIGPNGSGKSNLLKVLALLQTAPDNLSTYAMETGDVWDWFWQPNRYDANASIDVTASFLSRTSTHHSLVFSPHEGCFKVQREEVRHVMGSSISKVVRADAAGKVFLDGSETPTDRLILPVGRSVLSLQSDAPRSNAVNDIAARIEFMQLRGDYSRIQLHRNWIFGDTAPLRQEQSAGSWGHWLFKHGENLANVLSNFSASNRDELTKRLARFYEGIIGITTPVNDGKVSLLLEESGDQLIPAARLSDGTLRYLSLLAVLLDPSPPPLVGIEEPELGLHPDAIYDLAKLLVEASERTQLVVTTHSPTLIDALTDHPSSVVACEKYNGQTRFRRVNPEALASWIGDQGLGEVWAGGGIGGNRW